MMDESRPGLILRQERERRGLSIEEVASQMRLSTRQVEALEGDDYDALPGKVFVRGFIGNYARLLQIDPNPLFDALTLPEESTAPQKNEEIPFPSGRKKSWVHYAIWIVLLVFPILVYEMYRENHEPAQMKPKAAEPAATSEKSAVPPVPLVRAQAPVSAALPLSASAPIEMPLPVAVSAPAATGPVHLAFDGASWVEIRDASGRIVFSRLSQAGSETHVSGAAPFSLVIGNARAVRLYYEGKPVDLAPYIRIDVAHLTLG